MERSFVMIKPDGVQRGLVGEIISRLEKKGLKLVAMKLLRISPELAERHYEAHKGKAFFPGLVSFITSGPAVAMVWEGKNAVSVIRTLMGTTDPQTAAPGTIRGDLALDIGNNVIHGSDSPESAAREINLFFSAAEIVDYQLDASRWVYGE